MRINGFVHITNYGGYNSNISDIYSPKLKSYTEVKFLGEDNTTKARCGQFTDTTIGHNPYSINIINATNNKEQNKAILQFVKHHYYDKQAYYFIIGSPLSLWFGSLEEFLKHFNFTLAKPYNKRNGSHRPSQKALQSFISSISNEIKINGEKVYITNKSLVNQYYEITNYLFYINKQAELRVCAKNYSKTYHIEVGLK